MAAEGGSEIRFGEALASDGRPAADCTQVVRTPKIPLALSSEDLHELTAALASYIERQSVVAPSS